MSLGLICAKDGKIFLAAERYGLHGNHIESKVRKLQCQPVIGIVVAGGIVHWKDVFDLYKEQHSLKEACEEVMRLLDLKTNSNNQAYALLCGFENNNPICYRIDRAPGVEKTSFIKTDLTSVEVVGDEQHAKVAREHAIEAISKGTGHLQAVKEAIESRMHGQNLTGPVDPMVLELPK